MQIAGSAGTIEVNRFRRLANELESFRAVLIRHEQVLSAATFGLKRTMYGTLREVYRSLGTRPKDAGTM